MLTKALEEEIKELSRTTKKHPQTLTNYIYKCYGKALNQEFSTEFEYNNYKSHLDNIITDFLRDYAHFGEDNSELLKIYTSLDNDDELYNCCGPLRI